MRLRLGLKEELPYVHFLIELGFTFHTLRIKDSKEYNISRIEEGGVSSYKQHLAQSIF